MVVTGSSGNEVRDMLKKGFFLSRIMISVLAFSLFAGFAPQSAYASGDIESDTVTTPVFVPDVPFPASDFTLSEAGNLKLCRGQVYVVGVESIDIRERIYDWTSGDSGICRVDGGVLHASDSRTGTTTITARTIGPFGLRRASFTVTVLEKKGAPSVSSAPASVRITLENVPGKITLRRSGAKKKYRLRIKALPAGKAPKITYRSLKPKIASVTKSGVVKAKRKGKTCIVVKCGRVSRRIRVVVK